MFRLNRLTDYAVVVMTQMTHRPEEVHTAPQIANDTGIPLPTVAKLLNALARDSLVVSHRGAAGGYTLGRPAEGISIAEIIQVLEGPIALTACVEGSGNHCRIKSEKHTTQGCYKADLCKKYFIAIVFIDIERH